MPLRRKRAGTLADGRRPNGTGDASSSARPPRSSRARTHAGAALLAFVLRRRCAENAVETWVRYHPGQVNRSARHAAGTNFSAGGMAQSLPS